MRFFYFFVFFFFQAEDGIRDYKVTGVQTCALPISTQRHLPLAWASARDIELPEIAEVVSCIGHVWAAISIDVDQAGGGKPIVCSQSRSDRKSTRLNSSHLVNLVCRLLLEKQKNTYLCPCHL